MNPTRLLIGLLCGVLFVPTTAAVAAVRLAVSVLPLAELAERVGGEHVSVQTLVGPGQNPHSFEPTARQIEGLTNAQLFWRVGMPFEEGWMARLRGHNRALTVLDARDGLALPETGADDAHLGHGHGIDPHVWTSPLLAREMVRRLAEALAGIDPPNGAAYLANAGALDAELAALDAELRQTLAPRRGSRFLVYHPAWGAFAATYGLQQIAIEHDGKEPGARRLAELASEARRAGSRVIVVQPQASPRSAQTLAREIGARVVTVDPLGRDLAASLRALAGALTEPAP